MTGLWMTTPCWLCGSREQPCADARCVKTWRLKDCPTIVTETDARRSVEVERTRATEPAVVRAPVGDIRRTRRGIPGKRENW